MNKERVVVLLFFLLDIPLSVSAQIYKWTDANGKVQFSSVPPAGGAAEEIPTHSSTSLAPTSIQAEPVSDAQGSGSEASALQASAIIGKWRLAVEYPGTSDWTFNADGTFVREWKTPGWGEGRGSGVWRVESGGLLIDEKKASSTFVNGETVPFRPEITIYRVIAIRAQSILVKRKDELGVLEPTEWVRVK